MRIFGVILFIKLQNDTDFNGEKRKRGKRRRRKKERKNETGDNPLMFFWSELCPVLVRLIYNLVAEKPKSGLMTNVLP